MGFSSGSSGTSQARASFERQEPAELHSVRDLGVCRVPAAPVRAASRAALLVLLGLHTGAPLLDDLAFACANCTGAVSSLLSAQAIQMQLLVELVGRRPCGMGPVTNREI